VTMGFEAGSRNTTFGVSAFRGRFARAKICSYDKALLTNDQPSPKRTGTS